MSKNYKTERFVNLTAVFVILLSLILSFTLEGFAAAEEVRRECLRLHILACSDSQADQTVKLLVRDALLKESGELFGSSLSADEAAARILENKKELEAVADKVLRENGFDYTSKISVEREYFTTRQYDDIKLPAGEYLACKVVLGDGEGHNWWCIMFPPLCLPAASEEMKSTDDDVYAVFGDNGTALVTEKGGYKIKFRIVEIVEDIIHFLRG